MMLSNFRHGLKSCRPTSTSLFMRALNNFDNSTSGAKIWRSYSFDVAPLLGVNSSNNGNVQERSRVRPKAAPIAKPSKSSTELPYWVQTPVDLMMFKAESSDELWKVVSKYKLTGLQAVGFICSLAKLAVNGDDVNYEKIASSPDLEGYFDLVTDSLIQETDKLPIGNVALAFRGLLFLGTPTDHRLVNRLRSKLLKNFQLLGSSSLLSFAAYHVKYADTSDSSKNLQTVLEDWISSHVNDYSDANDLLLMLSMAKRRASTAWFREIEAKLSSSMPTFSGDQLSRLLNTLASKRTRSLALLKAIANSFAHCEDDLPIKKLANILSDLCILNYPNLKMITAVLRDIEGKLQTVTKPGVVCGIFSSVAIMRLRHLELLQALCQWTQKNLDAFTPTEFVSVLVALARCNYAPADAKADLVKNISTRISLKQLGDDKLVWLDAVWSLAILERLSKEHAASVLEKSFYTTLLSSLDGNDFKQLVAQLKLQNINTAAQLEIPGYTGPYLDPAAFSEIKEINIVQYKEEAVTILTNSLNHLAPRDTYMKTEFTCPEGYVIDALLRTTADGKPVPVSEWKKPPSDSWPVVVVLRHFNDITQLSDSPIGIHAMATRHLNRLGYVVLEIPALEIEQRRQSLARVQFLKEKLNVAIQKASEIHRT